MPRTAVAVALALLAGCGSGPRSLVLSGSAGADAFECALAEATVRGYAVVDAEAGVFFQARQPWRLRSGRRSSEGVDVLTATVARGELTVIASGEATGGEATVAIDPSRAAQAEATAILADCTR